MSEYPRHLKKPGGQFLVVHNDAEKAAGLKDGWALKSTPEPVEPASVPEADEADHAPVEKKKPGRKPKAD